MHPLPFRSRLGPTSLYNDCKGSEADGPHKGSQTSPIPGQQAYQGPVPEGGTSEHTDRGRHDTVLRVDYQSREVQTETHSDGLLCRGLRIPPKFSPCKTHSREMAQTSGFDPVLKVKHVLTARCR